MPKHWGLQYKKRIEDFSGSFVSSRLELNDSKWEVIRAEKELDRLRRGHQQLESRNHANERGLKKLMEIGPHGLSKIEGESGPEMNIEKFLSELDKIGEQAVRRLTDQE